MELVVHGGAGGAPDDPDARQAVLAAAADDAVDRETPLDAVEAALRRLETAPRFNAGVGGAVQSDGVVRTDAGVMTGDGEVGAVCAMEGVAHAVSAARVVHTETPQVLVAGEHATALAADFGVKTGVDLRTDERREAFEAAEPPSGSPRAHLEWLRERFGSEDADGDGHLDASDPPDHDTVGAVAVDGDRVAAATSTAGRSYALAGRVGDVPQIGGGFFASPAGAASTTGDGEDIARAGLARAAVDRLAATGDAQAAADEALAAFAAETGGTAGLIVLGADGTGGSGGADGDSIGTAANSAAMQTARASR